MEFPDLLTTQEAAKILKVHPSTITRLIHSGALKATQYFSRHWRIEAKDLKHLIEKELKRSETFYELKRNIHLRPII